MNRVISSIWLLSLLLIPCQLLTSAEPAWEELQERLRARYLAQTVDAAAVTKALAAVEGNGRFSDLSYGTTALPAYTEHLSRVSALLAAYYGGQSPRRGEAVVLETAVSALCWWLQQDYRDPNWWWTYIGYPTRLTTVTPIVGSHLKQQHADVYALLIAYHRRVYDYLRVSPMGGGANLADMGYYSLVGAVVDEDAQWLQALIEESFRVAIAVLGRDADYEGWQVDASMHAHGPQLHNATYGQALMNSASRAVHLLWGTSWDLGHDKVELLQWQLLEGVRQMSYGNWFDYNASGRGISRPGSPAFAAGFSRLIGLVLEMEPSRVHELQQLKQRIDRDGPYSGNRFQRTRAFPRSDYITRVERSAYTSVRMVSKRTMRNEMGNDEGRKNRYFGDGVHLTLVHGDEYDSAPVLWNYARIPGVTARQVSNLRPNNVWGERGRAAYAGSISDGFRGMAAMKLDFDGMSGLKSWFMTGSGTTALGSNIRVVHSSLREPVVTSINQATRAGAIDWATAAGESDTRTDVFEQQLQGEAWIWHRDIAYHVFADNDPLWIRAETVTGNWADVGTSSGVVSGPMFSLHLDHGSLPQNAGYAYRVIPGVSRSQVATHSASDPIRIIARDAIVHAVEERVTGAVYAAFWQAGTLQLGDGKSITVNAPSLLMLQTPLGYLGLTLADPQQERSSIEVEITGWQLADDTAGRIGPSHYKFELTLPGADWAGAAVQHNVALAGVPPYNPGDLEPDPRGWIAVGNFGNILPQEDAWVYHEKWGWILLRADRAESLFFYHPISAKWYWSAMELPAVYDISSDSWLLESQFPID